MVYELFISLFLLVGSPIAQHGLNSEQQTPVESRLFM